MVDRRDFIQQEVSVAGTCGVFQDGVLEGFFMLGASGAGGRFILVEPGLVGGQVALLGGYLVDSCCHELTQSHEGVWGETGGCRCSIGLWGVRLPIL